MTHIDHYPINQPLIDIDYKAVHQPLKDIDNKAMHHRIEFQRDIKIRDVREEDAGVYVCTINEENGPRMSTMQLFVQSQFGLFVYICGIMFSHLGLFLCNILRVIIVPSLDCILYW